MRVAREMLFYIRQSFFCWCCSRHVDSLLVLEHAKSSLLSSWVGSLRPVPALTMRSEYSQELVYHHTHHCGLLLREDTKSNTYSEVPRNALQWGAQPFSGGPRDLPRGFSSGVRLSALNSPATSCDKMYEVVSTRKFTRDSVPRIFISGQSWSCRPRTYQNSRLLEGKEMFSINYIVQFKHSELYLSGDCGNSPKIQGPRYQLVAAMQAGLYKDSSLLYYLLH